MNGAINAHSACHSTRVRDMPPLCTRDHAGIWETRPSGLPVAPYGAVLVEDHLRVVGHDRLGACGDAARVEIQPHLRMACATAEGTAGHLADQLGRHDRGEPLRPLSLGYAAWCLSLGRRDGLIQYVQRDDTATRYVTTGRAGAVAKELVCRGAVLAG